MGRKLKPIHIKVRGLTFMFCGIHLEAAANYVSEGNVDMTENLCKKCKHNFKPKQS